MIHISNHLSIQPKDFELKKDKEKVEEPFVPETPEEPGVPVEPKKPDKKHIRVPFDILEKLDDGVNDNKGTSSEKFKDVYNELCANVPDSTSTIEEKELALSYIDRMLACDDISPRLKNYWSNKKTIIQNEIQNIKNYQQIGSDTNFESLEKEFWDYSNEIWNKEVKFDNVPDRVEYWRSYYNTCISYLDRLLNCEGITDEKKEEYSKMKSNMMSDVNNQKADLNNFSKDKGLKTESFRDVINEMRANVPDSTSTIEEKQLAISYINRMLSCDDIPNPEYWENKKTVIEMEIQGIKNGQKSGSGENWQDAAKELNDYRDKYWYENVIEGKAGLDKLSPTDAKEYYVTVKRTILSFIDRVLDCSDLPKDAREGYIKLRAQYQKDVNSYMLDSLKKDIKEPSNPFRPIK